MNCKYLGEQIGDCGCCGKGQAVYQCTKLDSPCTLTQVCGKSAVRLLDGSFDWVQSQVTPSCDTCEHNSTRTKVNAIVKGKGTTGQ